MKDKNNFLLISLDDEKSKSIAEVLSSKICKEIINLLAQNELSEKDIVIDIGCNDGTLLDFYPKKDFILVGFEPSGNVAKEASMKGYHVINNFFNAEDFRSHFGDKKAKIITAISMFYDLEDPNRFLEDITSVLDENGLFIIQQNYLLTMLKQNAFDNILHEHREYYSLISLKNLLDRHGLEIFDVEQNSINGGSVRTYIKFKQSEKINGFEGAAKRINSLIEEEKNAGLESEKPYLEFASRIDEIKERLMNFLKQEKSKDKNYLTDSPNRRCPDISKARRDLGFNPQIGLDKGLSNILTWYREDS